MRRLLRPALIIGAAMLAGGLVGEYNTPRLVAPEQARAERMTSALAEWNQLDAKKEQINKLAMAQRSTIEAQQMRLKSAIEKDVGCAVEPGNIPLQVREFLYTPTPQPTWAPEDYDPSRRGR